jgi:hypothetical protein
LEVVVRKEARPGIVGLKLDESESEKGRLGVSWDILEENDGGDIQLIMSAASDMNVTAEAVIEGQREVRVVAFPGALISPVEQYNAFRQGGGRWFAAFWALYSLVYACIFAYDLITKRRCSARAKELLEKYLNPIPNELLKRLSIYYTPRWKRILWYTFMVIMIILFLLVSGWVFYALLSQRLPTPPLDF